MIDEITRNSILDSTEKMLKETRSLLLFVGTGLKIAIKDGNNISLIRLQNSQDLIELAQSRIKTILTILKTEADKKDAEKAIIELLAIATEHFEMAKLSYAYYLEHRENPDRSYEEIMKVASKRTDSLYF